MSAFPENTPEVARIASDLIRFDTSNFGGGDSRGEREAADYTGAYLTELGLDVQYYEPVAHRTNLCARIPGKNPDASALVVHGHLDVVPAVSEEWSVDPFGGIIQDGMLWGRGAVDMKNMNAMILTAVAQMMRAGEQPQRDLIVTFFADEENGGVEGSQLVVRNRAEWFTGATEAISEVGGYSIDVQGRPAYLLQVGEKALLWLRLRATGQAGHGSRVHDNNAILHLARALQAIDATQWPVKLTAATTALTAGLAELTGMGTQDPDALALATGPAAAFLRSSLRTTVNPTVLSAGYKHNVIPEHAQALLDVRVIPGTEQAVLRELRELVGPHVQIEVVIEGPGLEFPFEGDIVDAMVASLGRHDPGVPVLPYLLGAGTDNKSLSALGIAGYGFAPLKLPADLGFTGMFHGVDERVPVESLVFGQQVLHDFLSTY